MTERQFALMKYLKLDPDIKMPTCKASQIITKVLNKRGLVASNGKVWRKDGRPISVTRRGLPGEVGFSPMGHMDYCDDGNGNVWEMENDFEMEMGSDDVWMHYD